MRQILDLAPPLWAAFRVIAVVGALVTAWVGVQTDLAATRTDLSNLKVAVSAERLEQREERVRLLRKIEDLSYAIGALQLDMAAICTETLGIEKCYTAGRPQPKKDGDRDE